MASSRVEATRARLKYSLERAQKYLNKQSVLSGHTDTKVKLTFAKCYRPSVRLSVTVCLTGRMGVSTRLRNSGDDAFSCGLSLKGAAKIKSIFIVYDRL